jgi:hypothetical protein
MSVISYLASRTAELQIPRRRDMDSIGIKWSGEVVGGKLHGPEGVAPGLEPRDLPETRQRPLEVEVSRCCGVYVTAPLLSRLVDHDALEWLPDTHRQRDKRKSGRPGACPTSVRRRTLRKEEAMTVTLNFKPEIEAGLFAQAEASGMTVEGDVVSMVQGAVLPETQKTLSPEQRAAAFESWSSNHRATPPLSDYAVSREAMHDGRND